MNHDLLEKRTTRMHRSIALVLTIAVHGLLFAWMGAGMISQTPAPVSEIPTVSSPKQAVTQPKPVTPATKKSPEPRKKSFHIKA